MNQMTDIDDIRNTIVVIVIEDGSILLANMKYVLLIAAAVNVLTFIIFAIPVHT